MSLNNKLYEIAKKYKMAVVGVGIFSAISLFSLASVTIYSNLPREIKYYYLPKQYIQIEEPICALNLKRESGTFVYRPFCLSSVEKD